MRHLKKILLFSIFFLVLIGSLFYYIFPSFLRPPLRRDEIPSGARVIPWVRPNPAISSLGALGNWDIDSAMMGALKLNMVFRIEIPSQNETRVVPSTVYLGHDRYFLYVGGRLTGWYANPYSADVILQSYFDMFFDVVNDGILKSPEAGSNMAVFIDPRTDRYNNTDTSVQIADSGYDDLAWSFSGLLKHDVWFYTEDLGGTRSSIGDFTALYDHSTGTVTMIYSKYLRSSWSEPRNALQMRAGERWAMGFLFELGFDNWAGSYADAVDGWPRKTYPYESNETSWWPKLVIDLANPPANL